MARPLDLLQAGKPVVGLEWPVLQHGQQSEAPERITIAGVALELSVGPLLHLSLVTEARIQYVSEADRSKHRLQSSGPLLQPAG